MERDTLYIFALAHVPRVRKGMLFRDMREMGLFAAESRLQLLNSGILRLAEKRSHIHTAAAAPSRFGGKPRWSRPACLPWCTFESARTRCKRTCAARTKW